MHVVTLIVIIGAALSEGIFYPTLPQLATATSKWELTEAVS